MDGSVDWSPIFTRVAGWEEPREGCSLEERAAHRSNQFSIYDYHDLPDSGAKRDLWLKQLVENAELFLSDLRSAQEAERRRCRTLVTQYVRFDEYQKHLHSWHCLQDLLEYIDSGKQPVELDDSVAPRAQDRLIPTLVLCDECGLIYDAEIVDDPPYFVCECSRGGQRMDTPTLKQVLAPREQRVDG